MESYNDLPIGIDLGTTYSCIGVYRDYHVEIIPNEKGDRITPSVVCFLENEELVGEQTEYCQLKNPKNKIYAIKRIIGRNFSDKVVQEDISKFTFTVTKGKDDRPQIEVNKKKYSPEEISAKILSKLKKSAESFLKREINKVVITVPAYFTERQKQATKNAGKIAGLNVIKIINEPTAASLAYGFGKKNEEIKDRSSFYRRSTTLQTDEEAKNVLVFDIGGGTLDVTLLELEKGDISVTAHSGKMNFGGEDFDNLLVDFCIDRFKKQTSIDLNEEKYLKQKLRLKEHCTAAKIELSSRNETEIEVESIAENKNFYYKLTRKDFEEKCQEKFEECLVPINEVLEEAEINKEDIDEIILVGGSSKIPKIQNLLSEYFNGKKLNKSLNPDEAVANGAAIVAALQMGQYEEDVVLSDVCPFSLGIACYDEKKKDDIMDKIINKGSRLPCKATKIFFPKEDYQVSVLIEVYEGEDKLIKNNFPLGKFRLTNLPKMKRKEVEIEVTFVLNEDSILTVNACEKKKKSNTKNIVIKNDKGGLSQEEIENARKLQEESEDNKNKPDNHIITEEINYKGEIYNLNKLIKNSKSEKEKLDYLRKYQNMLEKYINTFIKDVDGENYTLKQKLFFYLKPLFNAYSSILNYKNLTTETEKSNIISSIEEYLIIFGQSEISFCLTLVEIFKSNDNDIFCSFLIKILGCYSSKGTDYYYNNEKKYAKHVLDEGLLLYEKYNIEERIKDNFTLQEECNPIVENFKELINIIKSEKIEKYCKSFSKGELIKEDDFKTEEEKINILDRFKDALKYLKCSDKRADKLLKAIYLANIVKIEYKFFGSTNYDALLRMANDSIELKVQTPMGCCAPELLWFKEIGDLKIEIEEKQKDNLENPDAKEREIKDKNKKIFGLIEQKFNEGKISFFYYILKEHHPNGLPGIYNFDNEQQLEDAYDSDQKKFLKTLRKFYNPMRYKGSNEEEIKKHSIMQEISTKLNDLK